VLRDYQEKILARALEAGSGLIVLPPGAGKTEIAIEITARLGLSTLFIVPTQEIFYQAYTRFKEALGVEIGLVGDEIFQPKRISIALWQTIWSGIKQRKKEVLDLLRQFDVVFFDEAHHVSADKIYIVSQFCPARHRYGLTATPYSRNNAELKFIGATGELQKEITASDLIKLGYLVKPIIDFQLSERMFFPRWAKWQEVYKKGVVFNEARNRLIAEKAIELRQEDRVTLILVTELKHGTKLNSLIDDSIFVYANASKRRNIVEDFKGGKIKTLISSPIFDEGIDIPIMNAIILAGGGKSPIKAVQRVGRGLRVYPGKRDVKIIDFNDPVRYLQEHSYLRYKIYAEEPEYRVQGAIPRGI
jgi:superfamily II DNA or RNA helicase